jgi:hypothetical protein
LAFSDKQKQLKALVPIREYMHKTHFPGNYLIQPLLKYFQELLELHDKYRGTQEGSATNTQILSNAANIQNLIQNGLQPNHPDLKNSVSAALCLNQWSRDIGHGSISLLGRLHPALANHIDHQLQASLIAELFASHLYYPISSPETLMAQELEHFEHFEDLDLKCRLSAYPWCMKTDISCKVNSTWLVPTILSQNLMVLLLPCTCVMWLYPWQLHLETQNGMHLH